MKEQILKLRAAGKSYREIEKELKCCRSLISYYVNPSRKAMGLARQNKNRFRVRTELKNKAGGKCKICGYNKCMDALHFHHKDPSQKKFGILDALWGKCKHTEQEIMEEMNKCVLLCANCHAEEHSRNYFGV